MLVLFGDGVSGEDLDPDLDLDLDLDPDLDLDLDLDMDLDLEPEGLLLTETDLRFSDRDTSRRLPRDLVLSTAGERLRTGLRRLR